MMAKTDSDTFPNTLGEDLYRRGQKKAEKVHIIIRNNVLRSTFKPLVAHHATAKCFFFLLLKSIKVGRSFHFIMLDFNHTHTNYW